MELAERREGFRARGLEVAALSYDPVAVLADFASRKRIPFPLLSDPRSEIIRRFGLLDPQYPEGDMAYGVPRPGTFVVDPSGVVLDRSFEEGYVARRTARSLAARLGGADAPRAATVARKDRRIIVRLGQTDTEVFPGNLLTLYVDVEVAPGLHAYAAGEHRYRQLRLVLDPHPLVRVHEPVLPAARPFRFAPLDETVPVYEGLVRIGQDVTLADRKELATLLASPEPVLSLAGRVEYQLCSDTTCYPPDQAPVRWTVRVRPPETDRVPEALRRK